LKEKIVVDISNSTTLSWEERQRAVYVVAETDRKEVKTRKKRTKSS
jgi:hypothetical protein